MKDIKSKLRQYKIVIFILFLMLIFSFLSPKYLSFHYLARVILWNESDVNDYKRFPNKIVNNAESTFYFKNDVNEDLISSKFEFIEYTYKGKTNKIDDLDQFLESTDTTAFIVIKDDVILYEKYFRGFERDSINTSFSAAKSFVSALIGIAIDEGFIDHVDEPITNYIPELRSKGCESITIRHLLTMTSGIKYVEGRLWWGDDAKTYYAPNLRDLAIEETEVSEELEKYFLYNNYHPLLLGLILERATHTSVSEYLEEKIWKPLGMEYSASWSIDSEESEFEKMESGINARSIDYAKFGRLFLNNGQWDSKQVISEEWVEESTKMDIGNSGDYYGDLNPLVRYKYLWWGYSDNGVDYDFFAAGKYGQFIYVSPKNNVIIVRNGIKVGKIDIFSWPAIFYQVANSI